MARLCLSCLLLTGFLASAGIAAQPGENMALGKKYTMSPAPAYPHCTDPGDVTQLTDGKITEKHFWTQQGTVGWSGVPYVEITVDLGRVEPIGGVSFRTAAGIAGAEWPAAIPILTSDDGKAFRLCGDLIALDLKQHGAFPEGYAIRRLATDSLQTRGRYVRFLAIPRQFLFCDEIEVFRGPNELLAAPATGTPVSDLSEFFSLWRVQAGMRQRFETDIAGVQKAIETAKPLAPATREALQAECEKVAKALRSEPTPGPSFRTVLPYNEAHARLFQVLAALRKAEGCADFTCGAVCPWEPTNLMAPPATGGKIEIHTMRGEYRAAAVNLINATAAPIEVRIHAEGLPESPAPSYLTVQESPWTDTTPGRPVTAALLPARREGDAWHVTVLPGLMQQFWLTFHVGQQSPGDFSGRLVVEYAKNAPLYVPIRLRVYPLDFPKQTTLLVGGWSYTNGGGAFGVTPKNRKPLAAKLQEHFVNAPWATNGVMMSHSFAADGTVKLDTREMDDWLAQWPDARMYFVFLSIEGTRDFGGANIGTPAFDRKVGQWVSAWVRHLRQKGIAPERLGLLLQDEPRESTPDVEAFLAWAKAIRAAEPKVRIWEDPIYETPEKAPAALFQASDVLCPNRPMWLERGKTFAQFYLDEQHKGRTLHFYSCSGPAQLLDPYSYYRLQAWQCVQTGATGSFFWAFGDNNGASSWNAYLAPVGSFSPVFLDASTVADGKQMEAIREGIEDYEYFVLLNKALTKAKAAGRSDAAVAEAEKLAATAADEVLAGHTAASLQWQFPQERAKADTTRIRVLEALVGLNGS